MARTAHFSRKLVDGLSADKAAQIARFGDEATTNGAALVMKLWFDSPMVRKGQTSAAKNELDKIHQSLTDAIQEKDDKLFQEIADFLAAIKRCEKNGPANPAYSVTASYIYFCQNWQSLNKNTRLEIIKGYPALAAAVKRGLTPPTPKEICDHLAHCFGDNAPDERTVVRWARELGVRARVRK
jgi:hypothetical protein